MKTKEREQILTERIQEEATRVGCTVEALTELQQRLLAVYQAARLPRDLEPDDLPYLAVRNAGRAMRIFMVLKEAKYLEGVDLETGVKDAVGDMMHLAEAFALGPEDVGTPPGAPENFTDIVDQATHHFTEEHSEW